ncbi:MAG: glycosyltransferase [Bacteroidota bacterium]
MSKQIDILLPSLAIGGAEKVMILLAEQFKAKGYQVRFIVRRLTEEGFQDQVAASFEAISLQTDRVRYFPERLQQFYQANSHPDIIIASLWPLTFLSAWVAKDHLPNTTVICVEHGSLRHQAAEKPLWYRLFLRFSLKKTLKWVHRVVAVSEGLKEELAQITKYQGDKLISVPNPIKLSNTNALSKEERAAFRQLKRQLKGKAFLAVGRLKKVKNFPLLLHAFQLVSREIESDLVILGDGNELEKLQRLASELQIAERVHFMGFTEQCNPYYQLADTFVLSSDSEGFGNVIVEALMNGCTVVSTDCPYGPREILEDGKYGYLSPVGDAESLAQNMLQSIQQPIDTDLAKSRGQQFAASHIAQHYIKEFEA